MENQIRILVAHDNDGTRGLLVKFLEKFYGKSVTVFPAEDADETEVMLQEVSRGIRPEWDLVLVSTLIILGFGPREKSGLEKEKRIKESATILRGWLKEEAFLILVSGWDAPQSAHELGVDAFLSAPFQTNTITAGLSLFLPRLVPVKKPAR